MWEVVGLMVYFPSADLLHLSLAVSYTNCTTVARWIALRALFEDNCLNKCSYTQRCGHITQTINRTFSIWSTSQNRYFSSLTRTFEWRKYVEKIFSFRFSCESNTLNFEHAFLVHTEFSRIAMVVTIDYSDNIFNRQVKKISATLMNRKSTHKGRKAIIRKCYPTVH